MELETLGQRAKAAARQLSATSTAQKNQALLAMADRLTVADAMIQSGAASRAQIEAWLSRATASAEGPASPQGAAR